ncbi:MAG TPA: hypothetical protein VK982_07530 [Bacteroidales bacterium]|nr:hypothetical protein [Bacteroidales bacterium]
MLLVKCKVCGDKSERESMYCIAKKTGKFNKNGTEKLIRSYYHHKCWTEKSKENKEWEELIQTIKKAHGIEIVPQSKKFYTKLNDIRNGDYGTGKKRMKNKSGYEYPIITKAYKIYWNEMYRAIKYLRMKNPNSSMEDELNYGLGVIINRLEDVRRIEKRQELESKIMKEREEKDLIQYESKREAKYKKKKFDDDISDFL